MKDMTSTWYDNFYKKEQIGYPPWYKFLYPLLISKITDKTKLVELGCGQSHILRVLANIMPQSNMTGIDQSIEAICFSRKHLPIATFICDDIHQMHECKDGHFDICLFMETIEHIEYPNNALPSINRIIKKGGLLYMSFPNYFHLPWLLVRILAEKLNHPNWIVLQPIDKIYNVLHIRKMMKKHGFKFNRAVGSVYFPPVLYVYEKPWITNLLNKFNLWWLSFHPVMEFEKI